MDNQQSKPLVYEDTEHTFKNKDISINFDSNTVKLRTKTLLKHMNCLQDQSDKARLENKSIEESRLKLALSLRKF